MGALLSINQNQNQNKSMNEGTIPALLKKATIVPIYKGGNNSAACNYRPVSLTSNIMKIFERVIRKQLVDYMTENDLLNHTQHGFLHRWSCLSVLLSVYEYDDLVNMNITASAVHMIYLDFSKAFDKVDHGILEVEHKLSQIGVCGKLGVWIHNFLQERSQYVRVPGRLAPMWQQSGTLIFCSCHEIAGFLVDELQI